MSATRLTRSSFSRSSSASYLRLSSSPHTPAAWRASCAASSSAASSAIRASAALRLAVSCCTCSCQPISACTRASASQSLRQCATHAASCGRISRAAAVRSSRRCSRSSRHTSIHACQPRASPCCISRFTAELAIPSTRASLSRSSSSSSFFLPSSLDSASLTRLSRTLTASASSTRTLASSASTSRRCCASYSTSRCMRSLSVILSLASQSRRHSARLAARAGRANRIAACCSSRRVCASARYVSAHACQPRASPCCIIRFTDELASFATRASRSRSSDSTSSRSRCSRPPSTSASFRRSSAFSASAASRSCCISVCNRFSSASRRARPVSTSLSLPTCAARIASSQSDRHELKVADSSGRRRALAAFRSSRRS